MMKILLTTIGILLFTTLSVTAEEKQRLAGEKSQQQTQSGSIRGCRLDLPNLQVLAPRNRIATIGEAQTFLLKVSEIPPYPIKVSITQPYVSDTVWLDELIVNQAGIITVTIPDNITLKPDTDYIFTASIPCGENQLSGSKFVRIFFQYADNQLISQKNQDENINTLLKNDIFYDALFFSYQQRLPQFEQILELEGIEIFN